MSRVAPGRAERGLDARAFCGARYPWPLIEELTEGLDVAGCYIVHESRRGETKQNKPYLKLLLGDRSGTIDAFVWDEVERWASACVPELYVGVRGRVGSFQSRLQLRIESVEPLEPAPGDLELLLPASPRSREAMERELQTLIGSVTDPGLRGVLQRCLGRSTATGREFRTHPAAKRNHHAYLAGLLEHSISVASSCDRLAAHYAAQGAPLDRDLLVTAALLHDIGKLRELRGMPSAAYTTEGKLLGHILIGVQMVSAEAEAVPQLAEERRLLLLHLIASHQGRAEWDSPRVPQTREALVLHYADDLDAKLNQAGALLGATTPGEWTAYDRSLERSFYRSPEQPRAETRNRDDDPDEPIDLFRG